MDTYSLFELNEYIKRVVALNFNEPIWINAEISQVKSSRGQVYMDLVEKDEVTDSILAQSSGIIWYKNYLFLKRKLGDILDDILIDGVEVKLKVNVEFHEKFGLKLNVQDIDPSFTLGKLELQKKAIIDKLEKEDLINKNAELILPTVIQNIAVISSSTAAGLQDFEKQLANNPYGYYFKMTLFQSAVQGTKTEREIIKAIAEINEEKESFDCITILRGGGSKLDLSGFDNYEIGKAIAFSEIPVITGIGHEIDLSIADLCAHTALKTPTAIANFLIDNLLHFESSLQELMRSIGTRVSSRIGNEHLKMQHFNSSLYRIFQNKLDLSKQSLDYHEKNLEKLINGVFQKAKENISRSESIIKLVKPENILKKGYTITRVNGKAITSKKEVKKGDELKTELKDGSIISKAN